jgi:hypothetical protein
MHHHVKYSPIITEFCKPREKCLNALSHQISLRVAGFLEREGLLVRDIENDYLSLDGLEEDPMLQIHGHLITYRMAIPDAL